MGRAKQSLDNLNFGSGYQESRGFGESCEEVAYRKFGDGFDLGFEQRET